MPTKVISVDLVAPLTTIRDLQGYTFARIVVRLAGQTVGTVRVPVHGDRCPGTAVAEAIVTELGPALLRQRLLAVLETPMVRRRLDIESAVTALPNDDLLDERQMPSITVAVCTRDRPEQLDRCLAALCRLHHGARVLVVDNAATSKASARLVAERYPQFDYVAEPRPGLDHARNRAITETSSDVLAFTDDDVIVDERWTWALARAFGEEPELGAVTGLVLPFETETPAQELFERLGGFGRGFTRRWETACVSSGRARRAGDVLGAGEFGTGANMAFRRSLFDRVGGFDLALGPGTPARGGDDLEMFHRLLVYGESLRYEPAAIVFHQHRRTLAELEAQMRDNGAQWAVMTAARAGGRATADDVRRIMGWYVRTRWPRRILQAVVVPNRMPLAMPLAEMRGMFAAAATGSYRRSRVVNPDPPAPPIPARPPANDQVSPADRGVEVEEVDVLGAISLNEVPRRTAAISVLLTRGPAAIGHLDIAVDGRPLCDRLLRELIVDDLGSRILSECDSRDHEQVQQEVASRLAAAVRRDAESDDRRPVYAVSIVIATLDRPDSLRQCLQSLRQHRSRHGMEIVIVDNNPSSGLTAAVLDDYPDVVRVVEARRGLAYARNAGFLAATGEVAVTTDDDVQVPDGWLDHLLEPFARNDVMAVCGNIQPLELRNAAQLDFERMGALSKGFQRQESRWEHRRSSWRAFPAWELGATANAAFRTEIFSNPEIGLMDEALGPGMPSGVGEDSYLLYRIVRAGYTVVYEPSAFVYHQHRDSAEALTKQLTAYYSGHVAHNLTTLMRDRDPRAVDRIARVAAYAVVARVLSLVGRGPMSSLSARAQLRGVVTGPANYVRSQRRVRREGRSRSD